MPRNDDDRREVRKLLRDLGMGPFGEDLIGPGSVPDCPACQGEGVMAGGSCAMCKGSGRLSTLDG